MNIYEQRWEEAIWVCSDCGRKFGDKHGDDLDMVVTMHFNTCDVCLTPDVPVCSKRDYLYGVMWD